MGIDPPSAPNVGPPRRLVIGASTTAYIPKDVPALALDGAKKWRPRKMLEKLAVAHLAVSVGRVNQIIGEITDAVNDSRKLLLAYFDEHQEFREIGKRMVTAWDVGVTSTLL